MTKKVSFLFPLSRNRPMKRVRDIPVPPASPNTAIAPDRYTFTVRGTDLVITGSGTDADTVYGTITDTGSDQWIVEIAGNKAMIAGRLRAQITAVEALDALRDVLLSR